MFVQNGLFNGHSQFSVYALLVMLLLLLIWSNDDTKPRLPTPVFAFVSTNGTPKREKPLRVSIPSLSSRTEVATPVGGFFARDPKPILDPAEPRSLASRTSLKLMLLSLIRVNGLKKQSSN